MFGRSRPRPTQSGNVAFDDAAYAASSDRKLDDRTHAVAGTPTDCVIMAVRHILKHQPPDLVLSGVNHGSNLAEDTPYSGTVAAAMEGSLLGIRSIAMSLMMGFEEGGRRALWDTPLAHAPSAHQESCWKKNGTRTRSSTSTFPTLLPMSVKGIAVHRRASGIRRCSISIVASIPWDTPYFWFGFERQPSTLVPGTDLAAIAANKISVTPLRASIPDRSRRRQIAR